MPSFIARLIEGKTNRTPWGLNTQAGKSYPVSGDDKDKLAYFRSNGRYTVEEQSERKAATPGKPVPPSARPSGRSGPSKGAPITDERLMALARRKLKPEMNKGQLLALARDLGIKDVSEDTTNRKLVSLIEERQAAILAEADKPEGGEGEGAEGGTGEGGDGAIKD